MRRIYKMIKQILTDVGGLTCSPCEEHEGDCTDIQDWDKCNAKLRTVCIDIGGTGGGDRNNNEPLTISTRCEKGHPNCIIFYTDGDKPARLCEID